VYRMSNRPSYHQQHESSAPAGGSAPVAPRPPASGPQRHHSSGNHSGNHRGRR
jgi:hypothetical protein